MKPMKPAIALGAAVALTIGAPGMAQESQQQWQQSQSAQKSQSSSQGQDERRKGIVATTGKVVGDAEIKTTAGDLHRLVKLQKANGRTVVVDLGVAAPDVETGDHLFVHGYAARISGKPVIFARFVGELREVGKSGETSAATGGTAAAGGDAWRDNDWLEDDYGYHDPDFGWTSDNSGFLSFYGDADDAWGEYYDDVGDEGLFDI